jgi:phosphatidylserine/phosphatidylglycerophosphate/cardiolipin synthase-like enzyme
MTRLCVLLFVLTVSLTTGAVTAEAADQLCDPAAQDCRKILLSYINAERGRIDVAFWFMEDDVLADALVARFKGGLPVRALVDPRRNSVTPKNGVILKKLADAGIPMRYKIGGGILHWKFMLLDGQNHVQFSAANYSDYYFIPVQPYANYTDEGIFFSADPAVVNSFRTKFDDAWTAPTAFGNYANVATPARAYAVYPIASEMNFVPWQDFSLRSVPLYDGETRQIDVIMYKITHARLPDALIRARKRGVIVRLITEPDRYRDKANVWHAYNVDRIYIAGVATRHRAHAGFLHQKTTQLHSQGLTIFGSSNWTADSYNKQYEHNYFTSQVWFFQWFRDQFERKWANLTGIAETKAFVPLPPDVPVYVSPANGATGQSLTPSLKWKGGAWAHRADVYFGTAPDPPLWKSSITISPNTTKTLLLPTLQPGTTYYWRIVGKTMANLKASGAVWRFTTSS